MKSALYIEDGISQIIFTPESEHEKNILKDRYYPGERKEEIDSLMIVLKEKGKT